MTTCQVKTIFHVEDVPSSKHSHPLHLFKFNLPKHPLKRTLLFVTGCSLCILVSNFKIILLYQMYIYYIFILISKNNSYSFHNYCYRWLISFSEWFLSKHEVLIFCIWYFLLLSNICFMINSKISITKYFPLTKKCNHCNI